MAEIGSATSDWELPGSVTDTGTIEPLLDMAVAIWLGTIGISSVTVDDDPCNPDVNRWFVPTVAVNNMRPSLM